MGRGPVALEREGGFCLAGLLAAAAGAGRREGEEGVV